MANVAQTEVTKRPPRSLSAAMVVQFAAGGAVIPFISMLLRDRGLDVSSLSLVLSASAATLLIFPFLWGMLADRFVPLNRLFLVLNLGACVALAGLVTQQNFAGLLLLFVCYTAFVNPTFTLVNALGFHHLPNPREQFSALRAWGSLGWIIPFLPIAVWTALRPKAGLDFTLYLGMGICLAMAALSFWLPHTPPGARPKDEQAPARQAYLPALKQLLRDPNYVILLIAMFLLSGAFSLTMFYAPPFLEDRGVPRPWIGPIQALGVVFEILLFQWQAALIRRWQYTATILIGCAALLVRNLMLATLDSAWWLSASYILAGAYLVFYLMGVSMLVNHMAGPQIRATAQTTLSICSQGLGPMFANWAAGGLAKVYGNSFRPVFILATLLAALAGVLIALRGRQLNRAGHGPASSEFVTRNS